jgi:hypothetical protein
MVLVAAYPQNNKVEGCQDLIFSNVRHIEESDDYVGTEIALQVCENDLVRGEWREYEGYNPSITKLEGKRNGKLILTGTNSEGSVKLTCTISKDSLLGSLIWFIGRSQQTKRLSLHKVNQALRPQ